MCIFDCEKCKPINENTHWPPTTTVWPEKSRQISIKVAENEFSRKMIDFDILTKIA